MIFYTSLDAISRFANIDGPVTFLLHDFDIQLILDSKSVLENIIQYVLKIPKGCFFWNTL